MVSLWHSRDASVIPNPTFPLLVVIPTNSAQLHRSAPQLSVHGLGAGESLKSPKLKHLLSSRTGGFQGIPLLAPPSYFWS